jgi:hypothetical protein
MYIYKYQIIVNYMGMYGYGNKFWKKKCFVRF